MTWHRFAAAFLLMSVALSAQAAEYRSSDCLAIPGNSRLADVAAGEAGFCYVESPTIGANDTLIVDRYLSVFGHMENDGTVIVGEPAVLSGTIMIVETDGMVTNRGSLEVQGGSSGLHVHGTLVNEGVLLVEAAGHLAYDGRIANEDGAEIVNRGEIGETTFNLGGGILRNRGNVDNLAIFRNYGTLINNNQIINNGDFYNDSAVGYPNLENTGYNADGLSATFINRGFFLNGQRGDVMNDQSFSNALGAELENAGNFFNQGDTGRLMNHSLITVQNDGTLENRDDARIEHTEPGSIIGHGVIRNRDSAEIASWSSITIQGSGELSNIEEASIFNEPPGEIRVHGVLKNANPDSRIQNESLLAVHEGGFFDNSYEALLASAGVFRLLKGSAMNNRARARVSSTGRWVTRGRLDNANGGVIYLRPKGKLDHECEAVTTTAPPLAGVFTYFYNNGLIEQTGGTLPPSHLILGTGTLSRSLPANCRPKTCKSDADCPDITRCVKQVAAPNRCMVPCTSNADCIAPETCRPPGLVGFQRCK